MCHVEQRRKIYAVMAASIVVASLLMLLVSRPGGGHSSSSIVWRGLGSWKIGWVDTVVFSPDGAVIERRRSLGLGPILITRVPGVSTERRWVLSTNLSLQASEKVHAGTNQTPADAAGLAP